VGWDPRRRGARWIAAIVLMAMSLAVTRLSSADSGVPPALQALLLSRLATFDRNFKARAGPVANVLVLHRSGDSDSVFEGANLARAIFELRNIGGLPARVEEAEFSDPEALAQRCRAGRIAIVYLTVGLESETRRIAAALTGVDVMTVGTSARHAENGAVVGFALEEARPKLVLNLKRAVAQNVNFKAEVLELARIVE
jgi:hypothetical protein